MKLRVKVNFEGLLDGLRKKHENMKKNWKT